MDGEGRRVRHVALFVQALSGGGVQRVLLTMARALLARGYRVDLLVTRAEGLLADQVPTGVQLIELGQVSAPMTRWLIFRADPLGVTALARPLILPRRNGEAIGSLAALAQYLRQYSPDVLFSARVNANLAALLAARLAGASTAVVVSERGSFEEKVAYSPRWRWRYVVPAIRRLYREAAAIVAVSEGTAESFVSTTGMKREKLQVIHNPVVDASLSERMQNDPGHPWLVSPHSVPVLLAVGRLEKRKGVDLLLTVLARVREQRDVRLIVLGEGEMRATLERQIDELGLAGHVDLVGWQDNPFAWMYRADLFVLPSDYEGLPGVLIQALACGCPVVSTDCPDGPREILEDGRYGRLVPVRDPAALADAILETLARPPKSALLIKRGQYFTISSAMDKFEILFDQISCHRANNR
ncbi:glycosyltransferase [Kushneria phosphatilytica]|uniref:Glycosyltransferase n=1 Tax=Kushneria phosphatilytica TaxID=657387 RepID=A0A1S1NQH1_9GAMM|nr:glycosyltransferase [Kushneria phosphatilytica]OHV07743.1 hypothetical protein BH688_16305 [Kushneria phosphatilytica]QEL10246.1 glycosyltransferase [Kushneria phosphatilytica]